MEESYAVSAGPRPDPGWKCLEPGSFGPFHRGVEI